jgi:Domain of unknown function (DUF6456)
MAGRSSQSSGHAGSDEVLRALRFLARKTAASGVRVANHGHGVEIYLAAVAGQRTSALMSPASWRLLRTKNWVAAVGVATPHSDPRDHVWRLTARGRSHVRRQLSQSGTDAVAKGKAHPAAEPAPAARPAINPNESPAGWLARRRDKNGQPMISIEQLAAAERLRADFWFAGMSPRVTTNWSAAETGGPSGHRLTGTDMNDNMIGAQNRVRLAVAAVGPELGSILIDVCCHLKGLEDAERQQGWPQRSAKIVLQLALTRLARHYGLLPSANAAAAARAPHRHWGAEGYRPRLDGDSV